MRLLVLALTVLLGAPSIGLAQDAAPHRIESWPQAKVIAMGREIFRQDRAAWLATDALLAARQQSELSELRGWIVVPETDRDRVVFVAADDQGARALWQVYVGPSGAGEIQDAASPELSEQDQTRWRARQTAIANVDPARCGPNMNPVVVRDPDSEGWLVWLLNSTTDAAAVPIGGHQRFRVSADGSTVVSRERLSTSCLTLRMQNDANGRPAALVANHIVSDGPVETHVFLSLLKRTPIYISAGDKLFAVEGDRIRDASAALRR